MQGSLKPESCQLMLAISTSNSLEDFLFVRVFLCNLDLVWRLGQLKSKHGGPWLYFMVTQNFFWEEVFIFAHIWPDPYKGFTFLVSKFEASHSRNYL